jgi:hypothetical protein
MDPIFPTWRRIWEKDERLLHRLHRVDQLRQLRSAGNFVLPFVPKDMDRAALKQCLYCVSALIALPLESLSEAARLQVDTLTRAFSPAVPPVRWGRWLYLEKALEQATSTGDLLFTAVVLRSLGEEVLRLRALQIGWENPRSVSPQEFRAWAAAVLIAIEPLVLDHGDAKSEKGEHFMVSLPHAVDMEILNCMDALKDYIHPNYGSHILALYPESAEGSTIILDALEKILSAFLKLPWANDHLHSVGVDIGLPYVTDLSKIAWRLKSRTMETVRSHAKTRYSAPDFRADSFFRWLSSDDSLYREALRLPEGEEILRPLQESLGDARIEKCWRVSNSRLTFEFATARRTEQLLRNRFPNGTPSDQGSGEWFLFAAQCFELMIVTTALKIELYRAQMVRQVVDHNLIGIAACMRSLLEHVAISEWVLERLIAEWEVLKKKTQSTGNLAAEATAKIQNELARFLSGTMSTAENRAPWAEIKPGINVTSAVFGAFKDSPLLQSEYDFSSAALHGRLMRSLELCVPNKDYETNILFRGLRCLDILCEKDLAGNHLRQSIRLWSDLRNAARALSENESPQRQALVQALGAVAKLKIDRDFSGKGSSETDPIVFRSPLHYHSAFYQYCAQENLDTTTRRPEIRSSVLYDVLREGEQEIWFKVSAFPEPESEI